MNEQSARRTVVSSQRPRNPRVPVEFALEVKGTSSAGEPFKVSAQAIKISRLGATIVMDTEVTPGSRVRLSPPFGRELDAEVNGTWIDENDGRRRIGVKLVDADGWFAE